MSIANFYRGDTQRYDIVFKDANNQPIDLTGSTVWFTMKLDKSQPDSEAAIQKVITTHKDAANGLTEIVLTSADTKDLIPNVYYYYDIQLVTAAGDVMTIMAGKVKIYEDVTRSF